MVETKLRAGIVGIGKMGLLHMSILNSIPNVQVVALCDKSKLITKFAKKALSAFAVVNSIDELKDSKLDLVYITTPIPSHFKVIEAIYRQKIAKNVFVEKTLAYSRDEAQKLCSMSGDSEGVNMVGYERRFAVSFKKAYKLIRDDAIGKPVRFKAYAYSSDFLSLDASKATKASASRGGLLRDLCSHTIDLSIWFFGDLKVTAKPPYSGNTNSLTFNVTGSDGIEGAVDASWCKKGYRLPEIGLEVTGTKGTLIVNDDQVSLKNGSEALTKWYRLNLKDNVSFLLGAPEYYRESRSFIDCITNGDTLEPSFKTAYKVEEIIDQVKPSN